MNEFKPVLRLIVLTQTFVLFALVFLPALIRYLQDPIGKLIYGLLTIVCIMLTLLLRRALAKLD